MRILRMPGMQTKLELSASSIYELQDTDPDFPKSVPLSEHRVGWLESEVDAWIEKRVALRDDPTFQGKAARRVKRQLRRGTPPPRSDLGGEPLSSVLGSSATPRLTDSDQSLKRRGAP
jgi:prophage regulatory protein